MRNDLTLCTSLYCWDDGRCKGESRAANGTTCGNKKVFEKILKCFYQTIINLQWCYKGNCIHNNEAPGDYGWCICCYCATVIVLECAAMNLQLLRLHQ